MSNAQVQQLILQHLQQHCIFRISTELSLVYGGFPYKTVFRL